MIQLFSPDNIWSQPLTCDFFHMFSCNKYVFGQFKNLRLLKCRSYVQNWQCYNNVESILYHRFNSHIVNSNIKPVNRRNTSSMNGYKLMNDAWRNSPCHGLYTYNPLEFILYHYANVQLYERDAFGQKVRKWLTNKRVHKGRITNINKEHPFNKLASRKSIYS